MGLVAGSSGNVSRLTALNVLSMGSVGTSTLLVYTIRRVPASSHNLDI